MISTLISARWSAARPRSVPARPLPLARFLSALGAVLIALALPLALLGLWQLNSLYPVISLQILPPPADVFTIAADMMRSGELLEAFSFSLARVAAGFLLGSTIGIAIGCVMGLSRTGEAYLAPTVRIICLVPTIAWLPFFMMLFGIGEGLKIAIIVKGCFQPLALNTAAGVRAAAERYGDVIRVLELSPATRLRRIILPAAMPQIIAGSRLGLGYAWMVLVTAEMLASSEGIGYVMSWARLQFQLDALIVAIITVGVAGWLLDTLARLAERRVDGWYGHG